MKNSDKKPEAAGLEAFDSRKGQPLKSKVEALEDPHIDPLDSQNPYLLPPPGKLDRKSVVTVGKSKAGKEIKEWQAIMDHLRSLPVKKKGELPVIPVDERAAEVRAIKEG
jgi:5'-nucleotidase